MKHSLSNETLAAGGEVFPYEADGRVVYVKKRRPPKNPAGWYALRCLYRLTRNPLLVPPRRADPDNVRFESAKLRRLGEKGLPVPVVLYVDEGYFVMSDVGTTVETVLRNEPGMRDEVTEKCCAALRRLHDAGEVHGGTQIKNLAFRDGCISFIDFEEDAPEEFLPEFRLRDLYLFTSSLERNGHDPNLARVCRWYDPGGNAGMLARLSRALCGLRAARVLENRLLAGFAMRDVRALNRLIGKAREALAKPAGEE